MGQIERFDRYREKWLKRATKEITKMGGTVLTEHNLDFHEDTGDIPQLIIDAEPQALAAVVITFSLENAIYHFTMPFAKVGQPLPAEVGTFVEKQLAQPTLHIFGRGWFANDDDSLQQELNNDKNLKKALRGFINQIRISNTFYRYEHNMQTVGYEGNKTYIATRPGLSDTILGKVCYVADGVKAIKVIQNHFHNNAGAAFDIRYKPHFGSVLKMTSNA